MTPLSCPNCGAPATVAPGQAINTCSFCRQSWQVQPPAAPAPLPPPPPPQPMYQPIIVVAPGAATEMASTAARGAAFGIVSMVLVPIVVLGVAGVIAFMAARSAGGSVGAGFLAAGWGGNTPLVCGGNDSIAASDVNAVFSSGSAIEAGGNCHVKCTRCTLRAPVAISAGGNATIELLDSHVEGTQSGVEAGGNAQIKFLGSSTLSGAVSKGGNAQVMAPPNAAPAVMAGAAEPAKGSAPAAATHAASQAAQVPQAPHAPTVVSSAAPPPPKGPAPPGAPGHALRH